MEIQNALLLDRLVERRFKVGCEAASLGEIESQSASAAAVVSIDCPIKMAPVPSRICRRLGLAAFTITQLPMPVAAAAMFLTR
jgi:hypothetical protein